MTISKELLDELLKGVERPEDLLADAGLMKELKIRLMERMLGAELTAHLGYEEGKDAPPGQANRRNDSSTKVLKGRDGELPVAVPRDRDSSFEPELVKKSQTRIDDMDDKIIGLYAAGLKRTFKFTLADLLSCLYLASRRRRLLPESYEIARAKRDRLVAEGDNPPIMGHLSLRSISRADSRRLAAHPSGDRLNVSL